MDQNVVTLIVGLGGIVSTLIASFIGIYYTHKARVNPYNENLFSKQLEIIQKLVHYHWRMRNFVILMNDKESQFKEQAREDLAIYFKDYSELIEQSSVVLPTELWIEVKKEQSILHEIFEMYDNQNFPFNDKLNEYMQIGAKTGLLSKMILGIDELTENRINLFSKRSNFKGISGMDHQRFPTKPGNVG